MSYRYGDILVPFVSPEEPLAVQDRHFVDCIANDARPLTDGENGLAVVEAWRPPRSRAGLAVRYYWMRSARTIALPACAAGRT